MIEPRPKLQFKDALDVFEAFDSRFSSVAWTESSGILHAKAELGEERFELMIEIQNVPTEHKAYTWLNVAFAREVDGKLTQELIGSTSNASRVIGAVAYELTKKLEELDDKYEVHAITLIAAAGESKRLSVYKRLVRLKNVGVLPGITPWSLIAEFTSKGATVLLAAKREPTAEEFKLLKAKIEQDGKALLVS